LIPETGDLDDLVHSLGSLDDRAPAQNFDVTVEHTAKEGYPYLLINRTEGEMHGPIISLSLPGTTTSPRVA